MKKKTIAIAFSDIHFHNWKQFNEDGRRITASLRVWEHLEGLANELDVPLLFCGDLLHDDQNISNELFYRILPKIINPRKEIFAISGNHDQAGISNLQNYPTNWIKTMSELSNKWVNMDYHHFKWMKQKIELHGIPYMTHNHGFQEFIEKIELTKGYKHILMIHTDLPGAKETDDREVGSAYGIPKQMSKLFGRFDLVISGHIHKPQQLASNVYMLGATNEQRRTDAGCDMGYWMVKEDLSMEFIPIIYTPRFRTAQYKEQTDDYNFWDLTGKKSDIKSVTKDHHSGVKKISNLGIVKKYIEKEGISDLKKKKALKNIIKKSEK